MHPPKVLTPVEVHILETPMDELDSAWVALVDEKLLQQAERQQRFENRLENLEQLMKMNNSMTAETFEVVTAAKGAFKFFGWVAQFAGMIIKVGAFFAASYATAKLAFPHLFKG
jgi:hypothetical protein